MWDKCLYYLLYGDKEHAKKTVQIAPFSVPDQFDLIYPVFCHIMMIGRYRVLPSRWRTKHIHKLAYVSRYELFPGWSPVCQSVAPCSRTSYSSVTVSWGQDHLNNGLSSPVWRADTSTLWTHVSVLGHEWGCQGYVGMSGLCQSYIRAMSEL